MTKRRQSHAQLLNRNPAYGTTGSTNSLGNMGGVIGFIAEDVHSEDDESNSGDTKNDGENDDNNANQKKVGGGLDDLDRLITSQEPAQS